MQEFQSDYCIIQNEGQTKNTITQRSYGHFFSIKHNTKNDVIRLHCLRADDRGIKDVSVNVLELIDSPARKGT